jgi:8-oxo-dGTP pyrophosphatase MutT (NUDIX family)
MKHVKIAKLMTKIPVKKVRAYIFQPTSSGLKLLVFSQPSSPEAGVQVPGGTVDAGESPFKAIKREVLEESGLDFSDEWKFIKSEIIIHPVKLEMSRIPLVLNSCA